MAEAQQWTDRIAALARGYEELLGMSIRDFAKLQDDNPEEAQRVLDAAIATLPKDTSDHLVLTPVEQAVGTLMVKSDVWEKRAGGVFWEVRHTVGTWRAEGEAADVTEAYQAINAAILAALGPDFECEGDLFIQRRHYDSDR